MEDALILKLPLWPGLPFISHARQVRELSIQRLPVPQTTSQELRPGRHGQIRIDVLRKKLPELGVVPTQRVPGAVAMPTDSGAQFLYFREQFVSRELCKVFVPHFSPL
jgi:hypothetical protein